MRRDRHHFGRRLVGVLGRVQGLLLVPGSAYRYQIWRVDAVVEGIPDQNFTTLEKVATPEDPAAMTAAAAAAQAETARVEFRSSSSSTVLSAAAAAMSAAFSRVWRRDATAEEASRSPRNGLAVLSSAKLRRSTRSSAAAVAVVRAFLEVTAGR